MDPFPSDWVKKESSKHPGKVYFFNKRTGKSSWEPPENVNISKIPNANRNKVKESCTDKLVKIKSLSSSGISKNKNPAQDRLSKLRAKLLLEQKKKTAEPAKGKAESPKQNKYVNVVKEVSKPVIKPAPLAIECNKKTDVIKNNEDCCKHVKSAKSEISPTKYKAESADTKKHAESVKTERCEQQGKDRPLKRTRESENASIFYKIPRLAVDALCKIPKLVANNFSQQPCTKTVTKIDKETAQTSGKESEPRKIPTSNEASKNKESSCKFLSAAHIDETLKTVPNTQIESCKEPSSKNFRPTTIGGIQVSTIRPKSANDRLQNLRKHLEIGRKLVEGTESRVCPANTTNSDVLPSQSLKDSQENTPMEWEEIEEQINEKITEIRQENEPDVGVLGDFYSVVNQNLLKMSAEQDYTSFVKDGQYHFVVDTNVFLRNLTFIEDLRKLKFCDTESSVIVVPYSVLQELDRIKMRSNQAVSTLAVRAIKYLNEKFESKDQSIRGQNAIEANRHLISIENADDNILNCCLQIKEKTNKILLLTNDVNLRNKAICNNIPVSTKSDLEAVENFNLT